MGRVYVYLMDGKSPICFYKEHIKNFLDPNPKTKWVQLHPDLAIGSVTDPNKAGLISFKLSVNDKTKNGPVNFKDFDAWKKTPKKRLPVWTVRSYIFQARDLPAADSNGTSDPFIKFHDMEKKQKKTRIIEDNCNPIFYETVDLNFEAETKADLPPMVFDVFDSDGMLDGDDFITRSIINLEEAHTAEDEKVPKPKWHDCKLNAKAPKEGELLVSFSVVDMDFNFPNLAKDQNLSKEVPTDEYTVSCQILGLRELKSPGILPVKKAFINFNIKSMLPPELGSAIKNIKTQPSALGPNPTINTLIAFDAPLPGDSLFCPRLSCQVYDNIYKGFGNQPLIGNFTIPIGDLMADLKEERVTELAAIRRICEALEQTINDEAVRSYSIQQDSVDISAMQEEEIKKQQEDFKQAKKKSFKAIEDDDMKQGLLANAEEKPEFVDRSGEQNSRRTSKRVTPRDLA